MEAAGAGGAVHAPEAEDAFGPQVVEEGPVAGVGEEEPTCQEDGQQPSAKRKPVASGEVEVIIASAAVGEARPSIEIGGIVEEGGHVLGEEPPLAEGGALLRGCSSPELDDEEEGAALWSDVSSGYEWNGGSESEFDSEEEPVSERSGPVGVAASTTTAESASTRVISSTQDEDEAGAGLVPGCDASLEARAPASAAVRGEGAQPEAQEAAAAAAGSTAVDSTGGEMQPLDAPAATPSGGGEQGAAGAAAGVAAATEEGNAAAHTVAATVTAAALAVAAAAADTENGDGAIRNGFGIKVWRDSSKYMGDWVAGKMTGYGEMRWADGRRYAGEWLDNRCNGKGVLTYKDGRQYIGEYKSDKMHGKGVYEWSEGARYVGNYREHRKHGRGIMTWKTGGRYDGEYVDDKMTGQGMMTWADGRRYEGSWLEGRCTGYGTTTFKSGSRYVGNYVADKMQGRGCYSFADGRRYEGEYQANQKHGRGVYRWPSGLLFTGAWCRGAPAAGFLLFPGGECAKTSCTSSSSSDACPDLALLRLQEEAQGWHAAREARARRVESAGAGGEAHAGEDADGQARLKVASAGGGGRRRSEKKDRWGSLAGRFGQRGADDRRPVVEDVCGDVCGSSAHSSGRDGRDTRSESVRDADHGDGPAAVEGSRRRGGGRERDGAWGAVHGAKLQLMNGLRMRRSLGSRRSTRGRKARAEDASAEGTDVEGERHEHSREYSKDIGRGDESMRGSARGDLTGSADMGAIVAGYSDEELDEWDKDDSEDDEQLRRDADAGSGVAPASHIHKDVIDENAGPRFAGAKGRSKLSKAGEMPGGEVARPELGEGDLWFYLVGEPPETAADRPGASAGRARLVLNGVNGAGFNVKDDDGCSRLLRACERGLIDVVMWYIRAAWAGVNHCDDDGRTPLHAACQFGQLRVVKFLLAAGAQTSSLDAQQRTPMYLACAAGFANAAFLVCRASTEASMLAQVDPLCHLVLSASSAADKSSYARADLRAAGEVNSCRSDGDSRWSRSGRDASPAGAPSRQHVMAASNVGEPASREAPAAVPRRGVPEPDPGLPLPGQKKTCSRGVLLAGMPAGGSTNAKWQSADRSPATSVLAVLRVWKTWASSEVLVSAVASRPALLSSLVRVSLCKLFGTSAQRAAHSLIYAIATHEHRGGKGAGAHQLAVLEALLYEPVVAYRQPHTSTSPAAGGEPAGGSAVAEVEVAHLACADSEGQGCQSENGERVSALAVASRGDVASGGDSSDCQLPSEGVGSGGEGEGVSEGGDDRELRDLPPSLQQCVQAIVASTLSLHLADDPLLTHVPAVVRLFTDLQELVVERTNVKTLPASLAACSKLRVLSLRHSRVAKMPTTIPHLRALRQLDVSYNSLGLLPTCVSHLVELRLLLVSANRLTELPEAIGDLTALMTLAADDNLLTCWPQRLSECHALETLHGHKNLSLPPPPCLSALTCLTTLTLNNNSVDSPCTGGARCDDNHEQAEGADRPRQQAAKVRQLEALNLGLLDLSCNALKSFPALVARTTTPLLRILDLSDNLLDTLPASIGDLETLATLHLRNNRLRQLPPSLSRTLIMKTNDLTVAGNPLVHPFPLPPLPATQYPSVTQRNTDRNSAPAQQPALREPPREWVLQLMNELWELDRAKSQRLALSLVAFGPAKSDFLLGVLDALFSSTPTDTACGVQAARKGSWLPRFWGSHRRRAQLKDGLGPQGSYGGASDGTEVDGVEVLAEHSRRVVEAGGQQIHLRIAAAAAATVSSAGSGLLAAPQVSCTRSGMPRRSVAAEEQPGSSPWSEEQALREMLAEELLPARMLPIFVWQSGTPTAQVLVEAEAFLRRLARSANRHAEAAAAAAAAAGGASPEGSSVDACVGSEVWCRSFGIFLLCVADKGAASSAVSAGDGGRNQQALVVQYFQKAARAAAHRRCLDTAPGQAAAGCEAGDGDFKPVVAADIEIKGFYTLDGEHEACARVPISPCGELGMRADSGAARCGRGVVGVRKSELVSDLAAVSRTLLLNDRFFPDAFVPASLLQFASLIQTPGATCTRKRPNWAEARSREGVVGAAAGMGGDGEDEGESAVWPMEKARQLAKARCGIASSSSLFHHALDLLHGAGHALVLPSSFCLPCPPAPLVAVAGQERHVHVRGEEVDVVMKSGGAGMVRAQNRGGVGVVGGGKMVGWSGVVVRDGGSLGWIAQAVRIVLTASQILNGQSRSRSGQEEQSRNELLPSCTVSHERTSLASAGNPAAWSTVVFALPPTLFKQAGTRFVPTPWRSSSSAAADHAQEATSSGASHLAEALERCDAGATALRTGLLVPAVAELLFSRPGFPHWNVTTEILARLGFLVLPARTGGDRHEWTGPAHVPLLCSRCPPPPGVVPMPEGEGSRLLQVGLLQARPCPRTSRLVQGEGGGSAGAMRGESTREVAFLRVLMRRVLGSLSLACGTVSAPEEVPEGRGSWEKAASNADTCSSEALSWVSSPVAAGSVVWRACSNDDSASDEAVGGGGLVRVLEGLWVQVELRQEVNASPCLCVTVAREVAAPETGGGEAMSEEGSEDADGGGCEKGWEVLVEMQRMTDDIARHLVPGAGRLLWRGWSES